MKTTKEIGDYAEKNAENFLLKNGLKIIQKNFRTRFGEIDLIAQEENQTIIFVEVRYRKNKNFGGAAESITSKKQQKIIKAATEFLANYQGITPFCRFDCLIFEQQILEPIWIKNAFAI